MIMGQYDLFIRSQIRNRVIEKSLSQIIFPSWDRRMKIKNFEYVEFNYRQGKFPSIKKWFLHYFIKRKHYFLDGKDGVTFPKKTLEWAYNTFWISNNKSHSISFFLSNWDQLKKSNFHQPEHSNWSFLKSWPKIDCKNQLRHRTSDYNKTKLLMCQKVKNS
jgi:hypothetical protein